MQYANFYEAEQKRKGSSYRPAGEVHVTMAHVHEVFSFIDYIKGGTDLNAFIAIDFTGEGEGGDWPGEERKVDWRGKGVERGGEWAKCG